MADPATMMMVGTGIQGAQAIGSGIKGQQAASAADRRMQGYDQATDFLVSTGQDAIRGMQTNLGNFGAGLGYGQDLMNQAMTGGQALQTQLGGIANQLQGGAPTFDFQTGNNLMDQTMQTFRDFASNQRNAALDQAGQAFTSQAGALDAALAGRGLSRNSGVAAGALGQLASEQSQAMAGLNRDLANQAGQIGLQGAQFDVNRMLQEQQLGSNFALGSAAQQTQNLGLAGNLATQAYTTPLGVQQGMFQENFLNPFMQTQAGLSGLLGQGMAALGQGLDLRNQQVQQAGAGKGAAMGGMTDPRRAAGKGAGTGTNPTMTTGGGSATFP